MKARLAVMTIVIALTGCANYQARQAAQEKDARITAYMTQNSAQVKAGQMRRSQFYAGLYDLSQSPPVRPIDISAAEHANEMISVAKQLEVGAITQEQYDQKLRDVQIDFAKERQGIANQQAQQDQERRAMALQYYLQTRPHTTNCTGFGNSATCTSY